MLRATFAALIIAGSIHASAWAKAPHEQPIPTSSPVKESGPTDGSLVPVPRFALAAANTTLLASYTFDTGGTCSAQGWTVVDATAQWGIFWHVDDFVGANVNAGDSLAALAGTQSLWCGARASISGETCGYLVLPGYGCNWNQVWQTKACIPVTGNLNVSFLLEVDSEPAYDATFLEYKPSCDPSLLEGWNELDGGTGVWDGVQGPFLVNGSYPVASANVRVRLRFASDGGFADEDANYDSHAGAAVVDNLVVEGLPMETFEDEDVGDLATNDWEAVPVPGYGASYVQLRPGYTLVQQDPCVRNLSCVWTAIAGSTETYACGGFPQQAAVPKGNDFGQYFWADIESPVFPVIGSGNTANLQFSVYRDMQLDGLVFFTWDVRSVDADDCGSAWRSRGFVYFGPQKDWLVNVFPVGDLLDFTKPFMQVRLGIADMCGTWCGSFGTGACHSHAPLLDSVRVYRVDISGPQWSSRDIDMFQDTFPTNGTDTGTGRADAALSITASASPTILPGDSARIIVNDPLTAVWGTNPSGLATDVLGGNNGNKACYVYVCASDNGVFNPSKSGAILSGGALYPFKDTITANGRTWTRVQCWLRVTSTSTFVVDLNDNLFEAGDVVSFFFGAFSTNGQATYASGPSLNYVQSDVDLAAELASEFTILPLNGGSTTDLLYVDGMDGRSAQVYWDTAFEQIGVAPDRYDVRGPSSSVSNRPSTRVTNVAQQLGANYNRILWDSGDIPQNLGDGTGAPEKSNDYTMVNTFLGALTTPGGIYICGDDYPAGLATAAGASAVAFKSNHITFTLNGSNHRPTYGVSPTAIGLNGGPFAGDTFVISGGCPVINDFDMMTATGTAMKQVAYNSAANYAGVISKAAGNRRVMISGFSFIYIRDDDEDGIMDRADHLHDILTYLGGSPSPPTDVPIAALSNSLSQNYPNPFNPQTTIAFSLKQRGHVRIDVFDVTGALVRILLDGTRAPGSYSDVRWDGHDRNGRKVASGVYFYKLATDGFEQTRRMVLLK